MKTFKVINYLFEEINEKIEHIERYKERLKEANEFCEKNDEKMDHKILQDFNLYEKLDKATVKQNIKKIRKLLIKLEKEI